MKRITDLAGPPTRFKKYLVPTIRYGWAGRTFTWPVLLPMHTDADLDFDVEHWHVDARFTSPDMDRHAYAAIEGHGGREHYDQLGLSIERRGVDAAATVILIPNSVQPLPRNPEWVPLECRRRLIHRAWRDPDITAKLQGQFTSPAVARRSAGRIYCPHKGADLTTLEPDADGCVRCPMHQLLVRVRP